MSTTHTPGPVAVNNGRMGWALRWPDGATSYMPDENAARMFAAAPELLAACEAAIRPCEWCGLLSVADMLRAAVAKAGVKP